MVYIKNLRGLQVKDTRYDQQRLLGARVFMSHSLWDVNFFPQYLNTNAFMVNKLAFYLCRFHWPVMQSA